MASAPVTGAAAPDGGGPPAPVGPRVRLRFSKQGKVRFTSHRDVARMWERAVRRVQLPLAYSQGFSPRPRMHFGLALSTGYESWAEYLDLDLAASVDPSMDVAGLPALLSPVLPVGVEVQAAAVIDRREPSLQQAVTRSSWRLEVAGDLGKLAEAAERVLHATQLPLTRQRKGADATDDVAPYIRHLSVVGRTAAGVELAADLGTQPRGLRPSELVAVLGGGFEEQRACRTHQWIEHHGAEREPLPLARSDDPRVAVGQALSAPPAPHAEARAS